MTDTDWTIEKNTLAWRAWWIGVACGAFVATVAMWRVWG